MARLKGISKKKLDVLTKTLPVPIKQHMKRCKTLAEFLLQRMMSDENFIDINFNTSNLLSAIYYHDLGKVKVSKDYLHLKYCKTNEEKNKYYLHVDEGLKILKELLSNDLEKYGKQSFERYLYQCVSEHHMSKNSKGYPEFKGEEISLAGKVCAIIDAFDNYVFVGNARETLFDEGLSKFKEEIGVRFDPLISEIFIKDEDVLREYVSKMEVTEMHRNKVTPYGMIMYYQPIVNLEEESVISFESKMKINDPYYGIINPGLFIPIAEKTNQIKEIFNLTFSKVCQSIKRLQDNNVEFNRISLHVSARQFDNPKFINSVNSILKIYNVSPEKIVFEITPLGGIEKTQEVFNTMVSLRKLGIKLYLDQFGEDLVFTEENGNALQITSKQLNAQLFIKDETTQEYELQNSVNNLFTSFVPNSTINYMIKLTNNSDALVICDVILSGIKTNNINLFDYIFAGFNDATFIQDSQEILVENTPNLFCNPMSNVKQHLENDTTIYSYNLINAVPIPSNTEVELYCFFYFDREATLQQTSGSTISIEKIVFAI